MPSISVGYELKPPTAIDSLNLTPSKTQEFQVKGNVSEGQKKYYEGLRAAISEARNSLGEELTAWRDAVGNAEQTKETKKTLNYEADESDDEGEDDGQS
jgi:hypothetical protein